MRSQKHVIAGASFLCVASLVVASCSRAQETGSAPAQATPITVSGQSSGSLAITLASEPNPPAAGDNTIVVTVKQTDGTPVTDGAVKAVFSMAAMPSMNMPAMRAEAPLTHEGGGTYRGSGQLSMAGTWDVTISVARNGQDAGSQRFSLIAK